MRGKDEVPFGLWCSRPLDSRCSHPVGPGHKPNLGSLPSGGSADPSTRQNGSFMKDSVGRLRKEKKFFISSPSPVRDDKMWIDWWEGQWRALPRRSSREWRKWSLESWKLGFKSWLCCLLSLSLWTDHLTSLFPYLYNEGLILDGPWGPLHL